MKCAACGGEATVIETLLGDFVRARCVNDGVFVSVGAPASPLRDHGLSRSSDPETSHSAGASIDPRGQQLALLRALDRIGEGNRDEIAEAAGLTLYQASRRLSELHEAGLCAWTGRTAPGRSGRGQMVYQVAPAGRETLMAGGR